MLIALIIIAFMLGAITEATVVHRRATQRDSKPQYDVGDKVWWVDTYHDTAAPGVVDDIGDHFYVVRFGPSSGLRRVMQFREAAERLTLRTEPV